MIRQISGDPAKFNETVSYIKTNIVSYNKDQPAYGSGGVPIIDPNAWMLDFRKMFTDSKGLAILCDIFWDAYAKEFPFQIAAIEL